MCDKIVSIHIPQVQINQTHIAIVVLVIAVSFLLWLKKRK